ncbi:hypothetical protein AYO21_08229 [Fonsecaea monophora]|uniref:Major facilitator superfamily (MFS) profile domain-containing protein n=1 Tax=Fonsecaea monophora TaxID=254056 RepID=A0A177F1Z2_9EURO|nr:hypothetical protein AYO21_08229 [Fonsecaea monophora]OAG37621.1 hypothetical protein AYO21_08229 [Fonsecaea monophora]
MASQVTPTAGDTISSPVHKADGNMSEVRVENVKSPHLEIRTIEEGGSTSTEYARQLEKRVVRKFDLHVLPIICMMYLLSFLDRSNIGNAKIAGMQEDLDLDSNRYAWLLQIFYISFIVFEPFILCWKRFPPHWCATAAITTWGLVATLQASASSWQGLMACRFFLGMAEAGSALGIVYYLSFFYNRSELGFRIGIQFCCSPLATCFAGVLAYGITSGHAAFASWKVLFVAEGLPSVAAGLVTWFFLPDTPESLKVLTEEERAVAKARSLRQVGMESEQRIGHLRWKDIGEGLFDYKNYLTALMYFSTNLSFTSLPVFLPTILVEIGFSGIHAQGLTAPPYLLAFFTTLASTYITDRTRQRGVTIMTLATIGTVGYILLAATKPTAVRYFGVFLAAGAIFPTMANILPWVLNNQGSDTKRGMGLTILNLIAQTASLISTRLFPEEDGPYYRKGMAVCAAFMFFTVLLALTLRTLLLFENRRLDARYGRVVAAPTVVEMSSGASLDEPQKWNETGEENEGPRFRYVL